MTRLQRGLVASGSILAGIILLAVSWVLSDTAARHWTADVLVNVGATVFLIIPIYVLTQRLDREIEAVRNETRQEVVTIVNRVTEFENAVGRRLDEAAAMIQQRLAEEAQIDERTFDALVEAPTRDSVLAALQRAYDLGLISLSRGPRASASESTYVYVRVDYTPESTDPWADEFDVLGFTVEDIKGLPVSDRIAWSRGESFEDVMIRVGRALQKQTGPLETIDAMALFSTLRDALKAAYSSPERRPIWQLCRPQWAVTDRGIVTVPPERRLYSLSLAKLKEADVSSHMNGKPWVDMDSFDEARYAATSLLDDSPPW